MVPIEELRPYLDKHVKVRIMNALNWVGVKHVEELIGKNSQDLRNTTMNARGTRLGIKSIHALKKAIAEVVKDTA